ncbi:MAG: glycine cleavage system protein GcvH [Acidobacteria bacterium]|nr:glycine cleavage system protein GcvH [Acidobacteriota bacterium]
METTSPANLYYTKDHEWLRLDGDTGTVGITDHAQHQLGDVVFVELPEVGDTFKAGESFGSLESVKAVSEVYCPASGEVVQVNEKLKESPEWVNSEPYGSGWMIRIRLYAPEERQHLLSAADYAILVQQEER